MAVMKEVFMMVVSRNKKVHTHVLQGRLRILQTTDRQVQREPWITRIFTLMDGWVCRNKSSNKRFGEWFSTAEGPFVVRTNGCGSKMVSQSGTHKVMG